MRKIKLESSLVHRTLWSETDEKWSYREKPVNLNDWRIVGSRVFKAINDEGFDMSKRGLQASISKDLFGQGLRILNEKNKVRHKGILYRYTTENFENTRELSNYLQFHGTDFENEEYLKYKIGNFIASPYFKQSFLLDSQDSSYFAKRNIKYESLSLSDYVLFVIEFESGRLDIAFTKGSIEVGIYVIIEADRGEDCGRIKLQTTIEKYLALLEKYSLNEEIIPKKIIRIAYEEDMKVLERKKTLEGEALKYCISKNHLEMQIISCEYQWDMKKLTFFFVSSDRVDFRELVRDLYKTYKTRIWMCSVDKSKNWCLNNLIYIDT